MSNPGTETASAATNAVARRILNIMYVVMSVFCLIAPATAMFGYFSNLGKVSDFPEFYTAAQMTLQGHACQVYQLPEFAKMQHQLFGGSGDRVVALLWTPAGLLALWPIGLLPKLPAAIVWEALQVSLWVASVWLMNRMWPASIKSYWYLVAYVCLSGPLFETLRLGQTSFVWAALILASMYLLKKERVVASGLVLGLFVMKPTFALPWLVVQLGMRKYKTAFVAVATMIVLGAASVAMFGLDVYKDYAQLVSVSANSSSAYGAMVPELTTTIRGQTIRSGLVSREVCTYISMGALAAALAAMFFAARKVANRERWLECAIALAIPLGLLTSLHCHEYDLLFVMPAIVSFCHVQRNNVAAKLVGISIIILLFLFCLPVYMPIHYDWLLVKKVVIDPFFWALGFYALSSFMWATSFDESR